MNTPQKTRITEAREIAQDLLNDMETSDLPVERYLMRAKRMARLLRDSDAQVWLDAEMKGYPDSFDLSSIGDCLRYAKEGGRIVEESKYYTSSLPTIEAECASARKRDEAAVPKPTAGTAKDYLVAGATTKMFNDQLASLNKLKRSYLNSVSLYSSLKASVHSYVTDTFISLEFGDVAESIFDSVRTEVDTFVRTRCPKAAEKVLAISDRMQEGSVEACSEAMTSCRRLLMTVADSLFPPSETDWKDSNGKTRKVGQEQYKNRLIAFVESRLESSGTKNLIESDLEHFCSRLDAIYEKTCKGVHIDVNISEARLTIIQAYVFIGELANLDKNIS